MKWGILMLVAVTLSADVFIYRNVVCRWFRRLPGRAAYIVFATITAAAGLSIFLLYGFASSRGSGAVMTVMWLVWVFLLTALPRLLYSAGAFADWSVSTITRKRVLVFRVLALVFSVAGIAAMIHGATAGRTKIKVNEVTICSGRIPASFDGYRVVLFADMHLGTQRRPAEFTARMVDEINRLDADLVINSGDMINISCADLTPDVMSELSRIAARDGVVSVLGNHDLGLYIGDTVALPPAENVSRLERKFDAMGWRTLRDESFYLRRGADSISVAGLNFPPDSLLSSRNKAYPIVDIVKTFAGADSRGYSVVVSHSPRMWDEITAAGFGDLTLAGHIHAMQLKLKLLGRSWSPARYLYGEWSGLYEKNNRYLYINDGMGCAGYPMRIGAPPELTLITLDRCE